MIHSLEGPHEGFLLIPVQKKKNPHKQAFIIPDAADSMGSTREISSGRHTHSHLFSAAKGCMWNSIFRKIMLLVIDHFSKSLASFVLLRPAYEKVSDFSLNEFEVRLL